MGGQTWPLQPNTMRADRWVAVIELANAHLHAHMELLLCDVPGPAECDQEGRRACPLNAAILGVVLVAEHVVQLPHLSTTAGCDG